LDSKPGIIVGLAAEARVARPLGWPIAIGGGTAAGAEAAAERLVRQGVTALISFGVAGGLDPALRPGTIVVPHEILMDDGERLQTCQVLGRRLGGTASPIIMFGADSIVGSAAEKTELFATTRAAAVDMESGAVARVAARHGIPFAVLRAICDPAERDLPPAALIPPDRNGAIQLGRIIGSFFAQPMQMPALPALAADAAAARRSLRTAVTRILELA
jgi:adenosylhomocysteine nucleosidase